MKYGVLTAAEQQVFGALPTPFCVFSIHRYSCALLAVSEGLCRVFHIERTAFDAPCRELLGRYLHPEDRKRVHADLERACLDPMGQYAAVYRIRARETEPYRWVSAKGTAACQSDGSYRLYAYLADVHDETELHREAAADKMRQDALLSDILSTTQTAIFWKNTDRRFLGANKAFLDYYGFSDLSEILGKNDEEMGWHTEPDPYKNDELRVLQAGVSTYRVPGKCIARGKNRHIVASKSPLIMDGKIVGLVGSFEDVTREVHQQEVINRLNEKLQEQIARRELLMSISEVCIIKVSLADFTLLEYNDAMCRMIGCTMEEYARQGGRSLEALFTGESRAELEKLKEAAGQAIAAGEHRITLSLRVPAAGGTVWIGGTASFADYDAADGRPRTAYAVFRDTTDLIEAQKKLELAEIEMQKAAMLENQLSKMRAMIDGVPAGIGALRITDGVPEPRIQLNRYFTQRIRIATDGNMAEPTALLAAVHPEDRQRCHEDFSGFLRGLPLLDCQYRMQTVDGGYLWVSVRATVEKLDEKVSIAYFTYTNIDEIKKAEAELKESRRFYREVVQAAKLSTWVYDIGRHVIRMSDDPHTRNMASRLALDKVIERVPDSIAGLIDTADQPAFREMYRQVEQGRNASCEVWYKPANGREPRCERITYIVAAGPDGRADHAIGFSQNITADRKVEERYQRELGYLRQTDENNLGAKGRYNLTRNVVLEYTTKNDSFFKIRPGTAYDDAFHAFVQLPYQENERGEILDKLDRARLMERYQRGQMQTSLIYHRSRKGELPLWVSLNIHTYMSPETGDLEAFTYAYDVTGKMETDEIIGLIAEVQFDFIGLLYADADQMEFIKKSRAIRYAGVQERFCYSAACTHVRGAYVTAADQQQYGDAVALENILAGLRASGGHHTATYRRTENGRLLCKQVDYVWLDEPAKIVLVVRSDVTASFERDQEQLARIEAAKLEAERANEAKSTFLSSMSHDLRTPLNGILGFTALALREPDPQKKQAYLQKIDSSGHLLVDLVNDTLELSRIESGKAALEPEAVMPDDLVPAVVTALRPSAELKNIRLLTDFPADAAAPVWCDKLKVQKIVLNLLSNAIKYTPEGGTVSVRFVPSGRTEAGFQWSLCVEDNGIGMSAEFMQRMFEPFAQEKRSESLKTPGTGLGLSIVKRYVDLMGGTIQAESTLHRGTRWLVTLPIREVPAGMARKTDEIETARELSGLRVLLCEDNYMNMEIAVMLLKDKGVQTDTAENGQEGVKRFAASPEHCYDAVLMDLRMPVMDGITAARAIRALRRGDAKTVPIIAMTADAFEESIREAKDAGMNGYVTKPVEPQKLFETLRNYAAHGRPAADAVTGKEAKAPL